MDKKKSVSIRLNGKKKEYSFTEKNQNQTKSSASEEIAATQEHIWDSMVFSKNEKGNVNEEQKNIVDFNSKRQEKEDRSSPFWDDGKRDGSPKLPPYNRKKKGPRTFSLGIFTNAIFLSVIAAIIVGGAFGTVLLNMFTNGETANTVIQSENGQPVTSEPEQQSQGGLFGDDDEEEEKTAKIPTLTFYVMQAGAFSTVEKGNQEAAQFHDRGLPGVVHENPDLQYLFISTSSDRDEMDDIGEKLEEDFGIVDTYVKQFIVEGNGSNLPEEWGAFMDSGINWMEKAVSISIKSITGQSLNEQNVQEVVDAGQAWIRAFEQIQPLDNNLYNLSREWVTEGEKALEGISPQMTSNDGWEIHQHGLQSIIYYDQLVRTIKKQEEQ
ncbi:hypothetical protein [Evansella tamaricis]|uniref:SPOR domain-containing protein n=1 Tax=Evansella tamaricis TaxID=2069301 RepID=A0ABS6JEY5_9BACI|nr:hypothetical protein [Evansella tamaricis]MBU9711020.1 hypothetical protein [Evansella tamaricis]